MLERLAGGDSRWAEQEGLRDVWPKVRAGGAAAYWISVTDAVVVLSVARTIDGGCKAIWVEGLGGQVGGTIAARRALMGRVLAECEQLGRADGCSEIRIEMGHRQGWKRSLLPGFGFAPHKVGEKTVMRKAL